MTTGDFMIDSLLPSEMAARAEAVGIRKAYMDAVTILVLAVLAGAFIALAAIYATTVWAGGSVLPYGVNRMLGGLAVGAASVMAPAYISEIAPAHMRGRLTTIQQIAIISGLFFSFLANFLLAKTAGGSTEPFWFGLTTWRWMFWMELIPAVIFFFASRSVTR